ncbi:MAG: PEPxxWA-CTERM sorting domain-containing protein [Novosphingobium sp.]|nr:PEP-CTERM sorting domain-containing protein [Novosphingobium sp.]
MHKLLKTAMISGLGLWATQAQAATLIGTFSGNECGGPGGFSNCYAFPDGTTSQGQDTNNTGSPSIFKMNSDASTDKSTMFPTITGSEFNITYVPGTNTLSFVYTPGAGDPTIHYYAISQANTTNLFYDASAITSDSISLSTYYPNNPGYSHITFFDTGSSPGSVPEPATWAMMLIGFGLLGGTMRRRKPETARVRYAI